jgi:hypothetical protein
MNECACQQKEKKELPSPTKTPALITSVFDQYNTRSIQFFGGIRIMTSWKFVFCLPKRFGEEDSGPSIKHEHTRTQQMWLFSVSEVCSTDTSLQMGLISKTFSSKGEGGSSDHLCILARAYATNFSLCIKRAADAKFPFAYLGHIDMAHQMHTKVQVKLRRALLLWTKAGML